MGCGKRPQQDRFLTAAEHQKKNIQQMQSQLAEAGYTDPAIADRIAVCATCIGCTSRGYCAPLLVIGRHDLQDCQARWDAWGQILIQGKCQQFTNPQPQGAIMADPTPTPVPIPTPQPRTDVPIEVGYYFGVVRFPWPVGQTMPVLTPTSSYNAIIAVVGPLPSRLGQLAAPLPMLTEETSSAAMDNTLRFAVVSLANVLKFGPKLDATPAT
jgi:hypothetical protein